MSATIIGYARCSTDEQDLTAQHDRLAELGVDPKRMYLDHGLTGTKRARPGLDQALAAVRDGDTLVVPKLDRLARSVPDARAIGDTLAERGVALSLGGQVYDPGDPMGKMFFNILATFAEQAPLAPALGQWPLLVYARIRAGGTSERDPALRLSLAIKQLVKPDRQRSGSDRHGQALPCRCVLVGSRP